MTPTIIVTPDHIRIQHPTDKDNDGDPLEFYWDKAEWEEDPSVTVAIANAIDQAHRGVIDWSLVRYSLADDKRVVLAAYPGAYAIHLPDTDLWQVWGGKGDAFPEPLAEAENEEAVWSVAALHAEIAKKSR